MTTDDSKGKRRRCELFPVGWTSKIVFFGTPEFSVASLDAILRSGREVVAVVTRPDRPAGRGLKETPSAVKEFARKAGIPVIQPKKMKDPEFLRFLQSSGAALYVVVAYGRILPKEILEIPRLIVNVHASLLPKWRGAAPIQRAILAGDETTGVSIMKLVEEMDAGDVFLSHETSIHPEETGGDLEKRLAEIGARALLESFECLDRDQAVFIPQDISRVTLAPPLEAAEGKIDWNQPSRAIHNRIRGLNPRPGAFTIDGSRRIKIHLSQETQETVEPNSFGRVRQAGSRLLIGCSDRWLEILELQRDGKAKQRADQFLQGYRMQPDTRWS